MSYWYQETCDLTVSGKVKFPGPFQLTARFSPQFPIYRVNILLWFLHQPNAHVLKFKMTYDLYGYYFLYRSGVKNIVV